MSGISHAIFKEIKLVEGVLSITVKAWKVILYVKKSVSFGGKKKKEKHVLTLMWSGVLSSDCRKIHLILSI